MPDFNILARGKTPEEHNSYYANDIIATLILFNLVGPIRLDWRWYIPRAVELNRVKAVIAPQARVAHARLQTSKLAGTNKKAREKKMK
jgi:hypothetical protein